MNIKKNKILKITSNFLRWHSIGSFNNISWCEKKNLKSRDRIKLKLGLLFIFNNKIKIAIIQLIWRASLLV